MSVSSWALGAATGLVCCRYGTISLVWGLTPSEGAFALGAVAIVAPLVGWRRTSVVVVLGLGVRTRRHPGQRDTDRGTRHARAAAGTHVVREPWRGCHRARGPCGASTSGRGCATGCAPVTGHSWSRPRSRWVHAPTRRASRPSRGDRAGRPRHRGRSPSVGPPRAHCAVRDRPHRHPWRWETRPVKTEDLVILPEFTAGTTTPGSSDSSGPSRPRRRLPR